MDTPNTHKRLVLVTGARGVVGREYLRIFSQQPDTTCVAIARGKTEDTPEGTVSFALDLLKRDDVITCFNELSLKGFQEIVLIHSVGKFKFEPDGLPEIDNDGDGIDDEVYATNVETFLNVLRALLPRIQQERDTTREVNLTLCCLGSVSDKYQVQYWNSYTKAKNLLRSILYNSAQEHPANTRSVFINVSTVDTENENLLRPQADKTYWLKANEIAKTSLPFILNGAMGSWKQIDIFKESPYFQEGYYKNIEEIRRQWETQMEETQKALENPPNGHESAGEIQVQVVDPVHDIFEDARLKFR